MRIVIDTSVWSHALRRRGVEPDAQAAKVAELLREGHTVLLLGVILQEILHGMRCSGSFDRVKSKLDVFRMLILKRDDYIAAAELRNLCRANGVQVSTVDAQIAAACIEHNCALLTDDQDFEHISRFCPLQLL